MIKEKQLSFDELIYSQPTANIQETPAKPAVPKTRPAKKNKTGELKSSPQAFLPGLSRRGRPRSQNPTPPSVRATESRKRRIDAGGKRIELLLEPAAAEGLEKLVEHYKLTRGEIISRLIGKAAKRVGGSK